MPAHHAPVPPSSLPPSVLHVMYLADVEGRSPLGRTLHGKLLLELNFQGEVAQDGAGEGGTD